jgi:hypothetical protein
VTPGYLRRPVVTTHLRIVGRAGLAARPQVRETPSCRPMRDTSMNPEDLNDEVSGH